MNRTPRLRRFFHKIFNRITLTALFFLIELAWLLYLVFCLARYALWINALLSVVSLFIALLIVKRDENPAYKIVWILLICVVPFFGWLLYAIFGNKQMTRRMRKKIEAVEHRHPLATDDTPLPAAVPDRLAATSGYIRRYGAYPAYGATDAKYYSLGDGMFADLLADLERAERYIFMEYFIIDEGEMFDRILDVLRRRVAAGVDVRILYDDVGCEAASFYPALRQLEAAGIRCLAFNPIIPIFSIVLNHRDHRKFTVIDGNVAYTGGINLADEYINRKKRFGHWKDTGLRLSGDAAWSFTVMFLNLWNAFEPTEQDYSAFRAVHPSLPSPDAPLLVQPYSDSPLDEENLGENVYLEILSQAQKYVYIYTPYLIIDNEMQTALCNAAKRGVDVRILTPGVPDKKTVFRLTRSFYPALLRAGVRIYEYTPGFLHAKSYVSDDTVAVVGTINMDFRSLYLHFECATLLCGGDVIKDIRDDCLSTIAQSREMNMQNLHRRSTPLQSFFDAILRVLSPLF